MQFGVLQFFSWPGRRIPLPEVYARALQRIDIMDQGGFDAVWLAEHHFSTYSVCPSVHIMGTHIAARTKNLRIGTGVSLAPFYHPLRLAEEVALLDVLSGGRVNWGAGRGFDATEYRAFGVERDDSYPLFRENVEVVLRAWRDQRLTWHGQYHHFDDIEVLPKPLQDPMPVWMASSSVEAIRWAAAQGHSILMDPHSSHADIGAKRRLYFEDLAAHKHPTDNRQIPIARLMAVANTDAEARAVAEAGARWTTDSYVGGDKGNLSGYLSPDPNAPPVTDAQARYVNDVIIHGCPERVADQLLELEESIGLDYLLCSPLSHDTFMLLAERVLPRMM